MDFMRDYFQSQEITDIIHRHLKEQKDHIIDKNTYKERYQHNNDVFLHIRLHDATCYNVGVDYYIHCIKTIQFASTCKHIVLSHGSFSA